MLFTARDSAINCQDTRHSMTLQISGHGKYFKDDLTKSWNISSKTEITILLCKLCTDNKKNTIYIYN